MDIGQFIYEERRRQGLSLRNIKDSCGVWPTSTRYIEQKGDGYLATIQAILGTLGYELTLTKKEAEE